MFRGSLLDIILVSQCTYSWLSRPGCQHILKNTPEQTRKGIVEFLPGRGRLLIVDCRMVL